MGTELSSELVRLVTGRTARRVMGLQVELNDDLVVLRGRTDTFYVKQLAQEAVREIIPTLRLINGIVVEDRATVRAN